MLKSGKKRARRAYELLIELKEYMLKFKESLKKAKFLHIKTGALWTYKDKDEKLDKFFYAKHSIYNKRINKHIKILPNNTYLKIIKYHEYDDLVKIDVIGSYSLKEVIRCFKIVLKLEKRKINF